MSDALAIAASGLTAQEFTIEKIANDLANLNTSNYKATTITFEDMLYDNIDGSNPLFHHQSGTKIGLGTTVFNTSKDFSTGPLKPTNHWNDVAIDGHGFLQVLTADGNTAYSRNSHLAVDSEHYLTTQDGLRLADNIQIPDDVISITIHNNGTVEATVSDEPEPQSLGTIRLAKFINPEALETSGNGLYYSTEQTGEPLVDNPGNSGLGLLLQNTVEGSNVDMVNGLMQLTMAQRIYQLNAKAVQIADELEKEINEIRD